MRTLVILLAPNAGWESFKAIERSLLNFSSCRVLTFSDQDLTPLINGLNDIGTRVEVTPAAELLSNSLDAFGEEISSWLKSLRNQVSTSAEEWWLSKFSEMNFSDKVWFDLHRLRVISELVKSERPDKVIWVAEDRFNSVLKSFCKNVGIAGHGIEVSTWKRPSFLLLKILCNWVANAFSDFLVCISFVKEDKQAKEASIAVLAGYPNNWSIDDKKAEYRYSGALPAKINLAYLVTLTRRSTPRLRNPFAALSSRLKIKYKNVSAPIFLVEQYGSVLRVIWEYGCAPYNGLSWWLRWLKIRHTINRYGANVWPLMKPIVLSAPLVDWPKNKYWRFCVASASRELSLNAMLVPIFELVEGRAAVAGANSVKVRTVGIQQGPHGAAHRWRFDIQINAVQKDSPDFGPGLIAVEGQSVADSLSGMGLDSSMVQVVGAPRINRSIPRYVSNLSSKSILVLGEMHEPELTFKIAENIGRQLSGWRIILRPHPATKTTVDSYLKNLVLSDPNIFCCSTQNFFEDDLRALKPRFLIAGVSGACVSAAKAGWPVVIAKSNWMPNFNPLLQIGNERIVSFSIGDSSQLDRFKLLLHSKDIEAMSEAYARVGCKLLAEEADSAAVNLARVLGK